MDAADIQRRAIEARSVTVEHGGASFVLVAPTRHEVRVRYAENPFDLTNQARMLQYLRECIIESMVGWSGVKDCDLVFGGGDWLVPFDVSLVPQLLDVGGDPLFDELSHQLQTWTAELSDRFKAAAKNSARASNGTAKAETMRATSKRTRSTKPSQAKSRN